MKRLQIFLLSGLLITLMVYLSGQKDAAVTSVGAYGGFAISYLLVKLLASSWYKPHPGPAPALTVAAVIPMHNEDRSAFIRCLLGLLSQSRRLDEIWIIDDGSSSTECFDVACQMLQGRDGAHVIRCDDNRGKRHAQAEAFQRSSADIFLVSDSDTVFDRDCVREGLKPFCDPEVQAVAGNIRALNHDDTLLTRLVDLMYQSAMERERAAQSVLDSLLVASGALSFYRAAVVRDNLHDYLTQTFLGATVRAGDDARLTNYALARGRVVMQLTAKAQTEIPSTLARFLRQQIRWNRSFFREALYALGSLSPRRVVWWLRLVDTTLWLTFGAAILVMLALAPMAGGKLLSVYYLAYILLAGYLHRLNLAITRWDRFLMSPLYSILHILVLVPLRLYALLTIRNSAWMTRKIEQRRSLRGKSV